MLPIKSISDFWLPGETQDDIDEAKVRVAVSAVKDFNGLIYIDLESWPVFGASDAVMASSVSKLTRIAEITRTTAPKIKFGFYGLMPERIYWPFILKDQANIKAWHDSTQRTRPLAEHVDIIFPSLYTFYNDEKGWMLYAEQMLIEARKYGKPVYVFLWPQFHDSNKELKGTNIPGPFWRHELELCHRLADGVVLWGGWRNVEEQGHSRWERMEWDEKADWWVQTKEFLAKTR